MGLQGIVSRSREKISEIREVMDGIIDDDESTLIEKKEKLEEKVRELPVSGKHWKRFSKKLDREKQGEANKLAERFEWNDETEFEVAKIYANMTYFEAEIELSEAQKSVYESAEILRELDEYIDEGGRDETKIAQEYNDVKSKLKDADEAVVEAEKEFDRSRSTAEHFDISGKLAEKLEEKEESTDRTRREIEGVMKHLMEMKNKIT